MIGKNLIVRRGVVVLGALVILASASLAGPNPQPGEKKPATPAGDIPRAAPAPKKIVTITLLPVGGSAEKCLIKLDGREVADFKELGKQLSALPDKETRVLIQVNHTVPWRFVLKTINAAVRAEFKQIGYAAAPPKLPATKPSEKHPVKGPKSDLASVAEAGNAFGVDLYRALATKKGNLFFSPSSIHAALSMTYAGARSETGKQIGEVLRVPNREHGYWKRVSIKPVRGRGGYKWVFIFQPWEQKRYHAAYRQLMAAMKPAPRSKHELHVANVLWGQKGEEWKRAFLRVTKDNYVAGLQEVDFVHETEAARLTINRWAAKQTKDRTKDLIGKGILNELTRLVLTNAIYFKGEWQYKFDKEDTDEAPFKVSAKKSVKVHMMRQAARFDYAETKLAQVLRMPYAGGELSMIVLLPKKPGGLPALEKWLATGALDGALKKLSGKDLGVLIPKFRITRQFKLSKTLAAMGMKDAFVEGRADFSGMTGGKNLFISAVVHKAFVEVNEEGSEAAAATAIMGWGDEPPEFRADRPFVFVIRHDKTGAILFIGRLANPQPSPRETATRPARPE